MLSYCHLISIKSGFLPLNVDDKNVRQECIPVGCVPSAATAVPGGGKFAGGVLPRGGCFLGGESVLPGGGGWYPSMHWGRPPPWTDTRLWKHNLRNFVADGNKWISYHFPSQQKHKGKALGKTENSLAPNWLLEPVEKPYKISQEKKRNH